MSSVVDRFIRYVKIDTQSDRSSLSSPSTSKQIKLARVLATELQDLGLQDVVLDENGYVMGCLPSNLPKPAPVVGFIAHMDTSPDMTATDVHPRLVEKYDGGDIVLNQEKGVILSPVEFPELLNYVGQTLITTDGTTLLGADDKAGVAEIMAALEYLTAHPEIRHGTVKVGFTPDEEIGRGTDHFDLERFAADLAYTLDGGEIGELQYENFNAARAEIVIQGRGVHPGTAKDKMVHAGLIAIELDRLLPSNERPMYTAGYEGFYHLNHLEGNMEKASLDYIIRDHDQKKFEEKKELLKKAVNFLNEKYGQGTVNLTIEDEYQNMRDLIIPVMHIVDTARQAMVDLGVDPLIKPIRGGTDGAMLTYKGLPTPNLFNGGHNYHGKFEYIPVPSMEKAVEVVLKIIDLYAQK